MREITIAGSGMAGLTAAIYAGRAEMEPLVLEGEAVGGQLSLTTDVENYPGFSDGVDAFELIQNTKQQAERFGADFKSGEIVKDVYINQGGPFTLETSTEKIETESFIIATGASARWVGAEGEEELMGNGLSTCATCDGAFHKGDKVLVIGGGDSAMEESLFLTKFADEVQIVHRREELRASNIMADRAFNNDKIDFRWNTELLEIYGSKEKGVTGAKLAFHPEGYPKDKLDNEKTEIFDVECGGIFYAIGHEPNTDFLENKEIDMDESGYIKTQGDSTKTSVQGVFAAGDVIDPHYQQAVTAAGTGCRAAIDAEEWIETKKSEKS